jgi:hypothetical protein
MDKFGLCRTHQITGGWAMLGQNQNFVPSTNILTSQLSLIEHVVSIMIMMINNHYNPENLLVAPIEFHEIVT